MSYIPGKPNNSESDDPIEMDFRAANFPSDALSVKRFRTLFPQHFDTHGRIADGYANNDFFFPAGMEDPPHLVRLTELISDERTLASGAYYRRYVNQYPELLEQEDLESLEHSRQRLEDGYQFFKLADSPEMARLLIRQVEEEGERQAQSEQSKSR